MAAEWLSEALIGYYLTQWSETDLLAKNIPLGNKRRGILASVEVEQSSYVAELAQAGPGAPA
jgi:hypothetical protein